MLVRYFKAGNEEYLTRSWLRDPEAEEARARAVAGPLSKDTWNGRDFYVSFGEGRHRSWVDAVRYGFVSAGGGKWYSGTLFMLTPGSRVFVCIPSKGYVGVGIVKASAVPAREFRVEVGGRTLPILDAPLEADVRDRSDDLETSEYLVAVEWTKTLPTDKAIWEKGMFANQNSACKLRNRFTLERLTERFGLEA